MVEFAVALGSKLDVINKHSFNNFRLRVGKGLPLLVSLGPPPHLPKLSLPQIFGKLLSRSALDLPPDSPFEMEHEAAGPGAMRRSHSLPYPSPYLPHPFSCQG